MFLLCDPYILELDMYFVFGCSAGEFSYCGTNYSHLTKAITKHLLHKKVPERGHSETFTEVAHSVLYMSDNKQRVCNNGSGSPKFVFVSEGTRYFRY
jgi:hypothetical protein